MPDVMVTANNLIGKVGDNFANLLKLGSSGGEGFKIQFFAPPKEEVFDADDLTEEAFSCIRALAQVQDLVTDKSWFDPGIEKTSTLQANNQTLSRLFNSEPFKNSKRLLDKEKASNELKNAFKEQFSNQFVNGDMQELGERLLQIQQLNTKLVCFFSQNKSS